MNAFTQAGFVIGIRIVPIRETKLTAGMAAKFTVSVVPMVPALQIPRCVTDTRTVKTGATKGIAGLIASVSSSHVLTESALQDTTYGAMAKITVKTAAMKRDVIMHVTVPTRNINVPMIPV